MCVSGFCGNVEIADLSNGEFMMVMMMIFFATKLKLGIYYFIFMIIISPP